VYTNPYKYCLLLLTMYMLPQEIEVWYIIPALRKELSKQLVRKYKFSYEKTGKILGITKAAISQYLSDKRANKIKLSREIKQSVHKSADRIAKEPQTAIIEMEKLLREMKMKKCSCNVCKQYNKEVLEYCNCEPAY